jgi:cysteinyl-tRNA synthetase, unknown class
MVATNRSSALGCLGGLLAAVVACSHAATAAPVEPAAPASAPAAPEKPPVMPPPEVPKGPVLPPAPPVLPAEPHEPPKPPPPGPPPRPEPTLILPSVEPEIAAGPEAEEVPVLSKGDRKGSSDNEPDAPRDYPRGPGRGFPEPGPWVSFYGSSKNALPLERVARTFRIMNIEADPGVGAWTPAQIKMLKAGGRNRVISYMNVGSCENFREYWKTAPRGMVPCKDNIRAQKGRYAGYPTEIWMDLSNPDYQKLIVEHVAVRLAKTGVDGFYLDNLEIVEHGEKTSNGPCGSRCRQGGLDLVARLRKAFPDHLIVMQNATSDVTRLGRTESGPYAELLDGIAHEQVYAPEHDAQALTELQAWKGMNLTPGGQPFVILVEDYVGDCTKVAKAKRVYALNRAQGFSPYATDASSGQQKICFWGF